MNDPSATPPSTNGTSPIEAELTRRLNDLSMTTTGDADDAWEQIQARLARDEGESGPGHRFGPRLLLAAAAVVAVLGLAVVAARDGDGGGDDVRVADQTVTTEHQPGPDPPREQPPTTSTTVRPRADTAPRTDQLEPIPEGDQQASDPDASDQAASGEPPIAPDDAAPREPAELGHVLPEYTAEFVYVDGTIYFRREDDVGSTRPGPDAYGHVDSASWGAVSGRQCLTSAGGEYDFDDAPRRGFSYGLVGDDVVLVDVVMTDGRRESASRWTRVEPGLATWSTPRHLGEVDRIEGRDANGEVVVTIADPDGDYGASEC